MDAYVICEQTGKRGFASPKGAIAACRKAGHRLRTYLCDACKRWHVTKDARPQQWEK